MFGKALVKRRPESEEIQIIDDCDAYVYIYMCVCAYPDNKVYTERNNKAAS